jgi:SAM-dependent methyltransferase
MENTEVALTPTPIITINVEPPVDAQAAVSRLPGAPPTLPDITVEDPAASSDSQVDAADSTPKVSAPPSGDDIEVRFDDDASGPTSIATPPHVLGDGDRRSEPGDAPEVAAEDVMTVEPPLAQVAPLPPPVSQAAPSPPPVSQAAPLPPMRPRAPSQPLNPPAARPSRPPLVIVPPHVGSVPAPQSPDSAGQRRKPRLWWEDLFNDDYMRAMERLTDGQMAQEVRFIEDSLGVEKGGAVLDLGCGTGRHAIDLAHRGYQVVGFDLSLAMLAKASEEAQERGAKLNFMQGDMREMTFNEQFDGVYCWNTSFGYFEEDKNAQIIERVHDALKAGGLFLLDVVNRDFLLRQSPSLVWFEGDGCVCMDEMNVDFITSRMKIKRTTMLDDGRSHEIEYSVRVYSLHELGRILHEQGFKVREVSGRVSTPGVFFGGDSPRVIILSEKR